MTERDISGNEDRANALGSAVPSLEPVAWRTATKTINGANGSSDYPKNDIAPSHTPGPWAVCDAEGAPLCDVKAGGVLVAECGYTDRSNEEITANARLISAAPEMLAALTASREAWVRYGQEADPEIPVPAEHRDLLARIDASIAKAEGR